MVPRYSLGSKIDAGTFGTVYRCSDTTTGEQLALKRGHLASGISQLKNENHVYISLMGGIGIPSVRYFGSDEDDTTIMVLDTLGPSLEKLFNFVGRRFSLKTVLILADQLISRFEYIHSRSFIHRDIKPKNLLMGIGKRGSQVNVIDFGFAKTYRDPTTHCHIRLRENQKSPGTARYMSINSHLGYGNVIQETSISLRDTDGFAEQSRRDDMESLGYVLLYFCRGSLPWQGLPKMGNKQKKDLVLDQKMTTSIETLCEGLPVAFATYLRYVRSLCFEEDPDYAYLRRMFSDLFRREGLEQDYVFDWTVYKYQQSAPNVQNSTRASSTEERSHGKTGSSHARPVRDAKAAEECAVTLGDESERELPHHTPTAACRTPVSPFPQDPQHLDTVLRQVSGPDLSITRRRYRNIALQPMSSEIQLDCLTAEIDKIYAALETVERKCKDIGNAMTQDFDWNPNNEQWQGLHCLYRTLLYEHHDFLMATQHPSSTIALRDLVSARQMPARMWKFGVHTFLEALRRRLPHSRPFMLAFALLAYQMFALLFETVPQSKDIWIECLGDVARYRMAIEEDQRIRASWRVAASCWYRLASDSHSEIGRLYHHLGIVEGTLLRKFAFYSKSLTSVRPFPDAKESILGLYRGVLQSGHFSTINAGSADTAICTPSEAPKRLLLSLPRPANRRHELFLLLSSISALLEFGDEENAHWKAFSHMSASDRENLRENEPVEPRTNQSHAKVSSTATFPSDDVVEYYYACCNALCNPSIGSEVRMSAAAPVHVLLVWFNCLQSVAAQSHEPDTIAMVNSFMDPDRFSWKSLCHFVNRLSLDSAFDENSFVFAQRNVTTMLPDASEFVPLEEDYWVRSFVWNRFLQLNHLLPVRKDEVESSRSTDIRTQRIRILAARLTLHTSFMRFNMDEKKFWAPELPRRG